jgi:hypothetical protein
VFVASAKIGLIVLAIFARSVFQSFLLESLILAQDERWRRA